MKDSTIERVWNVILGLGLGALFVVLNIILNMGLTIVQAVDGGKGKMIANLSCCLLAFICVLILLFALKQLGVITFKHSPPSPKNTVLIFFWFSTLSFTCDIVFSFYDAEGSE